MSPKKKKNKYMRYYNFLQFFILTKRIRKKKKKIKCKLKMLI